MSVSRLTTGTSELALGVVAALEGLGYVFNPATMSINHYLATALRGIAGGAATELNAGLADLLAALVVALGGTGNVHDHDEQELMARIINAAGGAPSSDRILLEDSSGGFALEDGSGVILLEV